jgi:hypothetical protein
VKSVIVSFQLWSSSESFNTLAAVVGYVGQEDPEKKADFQVLGAANQVSGWRTYVLSVETSTGKAGEVFVALGISVRWETDLSYSIDDVRITIS